jgi:hypothetical protein
VGDSNWPAFLDPVLLMRRFIIVFGIAGVLGCTEPRRGHLDEATRSAQDRPDATKETGPATKIPMH